jgi:hypothetical protein
MVTPYAAIPKTAARHRRRDSHTGYEPDRKRLATVRHRTVRMKGALSQDAARLMVFKLIIAAAKSWRRLQGQNHCRQNQLPKLVQGATFRDGIEVATRHMSAA